MRTRRTPRAWAYGRAAITAAALGLALTAAAGPVAAEDAPAPAVKPGPVPGTLDVPWPPTEAVPLAPMTNDFRTSECIEREVCLVEAFMSLTLGNRNEPRPPDDERILKWEEPIRATIVGLDGLTSERHQVLNEAWSRVQRIIRLAGVDFDIRDEGEQADIVVFLSDDFDRDKNGKIGEYLTEIFGNESLMQQRYEELTEKVRTGKAHCSARIFSIKHSIYLALVFIPIHAEDWKFDRCINEELIQVLGPASDGPSIFNGIMWENMSNRPTVFDFLMIKMLYHPAIKPGMDYREVMAVFPKVYADIVKPLLPTKGE